MKIELSHCFKMIEYGFALLTVGENKRPNYTWGGKNPIILSKEKFEKQYNYNGGIPNLKPTNGVGYITGVNGLEVIDVDLKIFETLNEQQDFWSEYLNFLKSNIEDFDEKIVIYKTINNGYHLIYRCEKIGGNEKIARLKDYKEAIIETRGIGGYCFIYKNRVSKNGYQHIKRISEKERDILIECSRTYDYKEPVVIAPPKKKNTDFKIPENGITCWQDFSNKNTVFDVLGSDFSIVATSKNRTVIKRRGAKSAHSGYVFDNSGKMFLFSTGTIYPNEKPLNSFDVYCYKYHNGNYSDAAREVYRDGYGSRYVKDSVLKIEPIKKENIVFPIEIFPKDIQTYFLECSDKLNSSIDYLGCSFLWLISVLIGNTRQVKVKNGWIEPPILWLALIGKAGVGKTPDISNIISPLEKINNRKIKKYINSSKQFKEFQQMSKEDKEINETIEEPINNQFIVNDVTIEGLVQLHENNLKSIGVFKDELAGWMKDMNKYREGSDLEFWLSSWSGKSHNVNRKTATNSFLNKPFIPVLGGIQPDIFMSFQNSENKENGFLDRILFCQPDKKIDFYNEKELKQEVIDWYSNFIFGLNTVIEEKLFKTDEHDDVIPQTCYFSEDAKKEWKRIFNKITTMQISDNETDFFKSMLPKQKTYIPRFALIIDFINKYLDNGISDMISKDSILKAEKLSNYFILMARKNKTETTYKIDIKKYCEKNQNKTKKQIVIDIFKENPKINKTHLADVLDITRQTINNYLK